MMTLSIFSCAHLPSVHLQMGRCLSSSFDHFLVGLFCCLLLLSFKSCLCFSYKSFIRYVFGNTFSQLVFILSTMSFTKQKFLNFNAVPLFPFFLSWTVHLVVYLKTHHQTQGHLDFFPMLFSRSFCILHFMSMIHFELIFVKSVMPVSRIIFHIWMSNYSNTICWKHTIPFSIELLCSVDCISGGLFLGAVLFFTDLFVWSFTSTSLSWVLELHSTFWSQVVSSDFVSLQCYVDYSGVLSFHEVTCWHFNWDRFVCFWYEGNAGLIEWVKKCYLCFYFWNRL